MNNLLNDLGSKLVEDSMLHEEFSAQRGLINELFPAIYVASKRMSSRGISRWLAENGTKLSAATIAKALRNPDQYWQEIMDEIEPAAITFENAHNVSAEDFLKDPVVFNGLRTQPPLLNGMSEEVVQKSLREYERACGKLSEDWFSMPAAAIEACLSSAKFGGMESESTEKNESSKVE
jgi:hypothetical protein